MSTPVGLLGGTFDPVHNGHLRIADAFLASGHIDELWLIPAYEPPHKPAAGLTDYEQRCRMLERAFQEYAGVKISRVEYYLEPPNYSLRTVIHFQQQYPDTRFYFCIGSDSLQRLPAWYRYEQLLQSCAFLVAERPDAGLAIPEGVDPSRIHRVNHEPVDVSASQVRECVGQGRPVGDLVPPAVEAFISEHRLYGARR